VRPKLTLSEEDLVALRAAAFDINVVLELGVEKAIDAAPRTKMAELLTSPGWLAKQAAEETAQAAGKAAAAEKAASKAAALAARGGLSKAAFAKVEKAKAKAAAAAAEAPSAAEAAAQPKEPAAPKVEVKRKREKGEKPPAAAKPKAAGPAGDVYTKEFTNKRKKKLGRGEPCAEESLFCFHIKWQSCRVRCAPRDRDDCGRARRARRELEGGFPTPKM
jgi:hypothetical protein